MKCHSCGIQSDDMRCFDCFRKVRLTFGPIQVLPIQLEYIYGLKEEIEIEALKAEGTLKNVDTIERILLLQQRCCDVEELVRKTKENNDLIHAQSESIRSAILKKQQKIEFYQSKLNALAAKEVVKRESLSAARANLNAILTRKVENHFCLRNLNGTQSEWGLNNEIEVMEIPFAKKSQGSECPYYHHIVLKKKQNFMTQNESQALVFSLNQLTFLIAALQNLFNVSSPFAIVQRVRWTAMMVQSKAVSAGSSVASAIRLYDDSFRVIFDENFVYLYLNFKLLLHRFGISATPNPYVVFDFEYLKYRILAQLQETSANQFKELMTTSKELANSVGTLAYPPSRLYPLVVLKSPTLRFSYDSNLKEKQNVMSDPYLVSITKAVEQEWEVCNEEADDDDML